jgi:polar amino acid transport system substrate-binding protein
MLPYARWSAGSVIAIVTLAAGCSGSNGVPVPGARAALAPTNRLRVGVYPDNPISMIQDGISGETKGVLHALSLDIGQELARRLGVEFEAVVFESQPPVFAAVKAGEVDLMLVNATAQRARDVDFSPELLQTEQGFLVVRGSPVVALDDVDRPKIRVGVSEGSSSQGILSGQLKNAVVVPVSTIKKAVEMLAQHELDTFATNKAVLFELSDLLPDSRVLDGRYGVEHLALAIPKGRSPGMAYLRTFVEDVKSDGLVERAAHRAHLRGRVDAGSN